MKRSSEIRRAKEDSGPGVGNRSVDVDTSEENNSEEIVIEDGWPLSDRYPEAPGLW